MTASFEESPELWPQLRDIISNMSTGWDGDRTSFAKEGARSGMSAAPWARGTDDVPEVCVDPNRDHVLIGAPGFLFLTHSLIQDRTVLVKEVELWNFRRNSGCNSCWGIAADRIYSSVCRGQLGFDRSEDDSIVEPIEK